MPTFGSRSNNAKPTGGSGQFEMFIKNFKDSMTRIAVLDPDPNLWVKYLQHYDRKAGGANGMAFPCAKFEGADACIGCDYPVEHPEYESLDEHFPEGTYSEKIQARKKADPGWGVRDTSQKWVIPAIDPKGYISLYQVGVGLRDDFITQHKVLGSIQANEWTITREGTGFGTEYGLVAMPGEVRKPKEGARVPDEAFISGILGKKYVYAMEQYGMDAGTDQGGFEPDPTSAPDPAPVTEPAADEAQSGPQSSSAAPSTAASAAAPTAPEPAQTPATGAAALAGTGGPPPPHFVPREASTGEIKDFLDNGPEGYDKEWAKVDYAPKAARQVLIGLAEKTMTERDIVPF